GPGGINPLRLLGQRLVIGQLGGRQLAALALRDEPAQTAFRRRRQPRPGGAHQRRFLRPRTAVWRLPAGEATLKLALLGRRKALDRVEQLLDTRRTGSR